MNVPLRGLLLSVSLVAGVVSAVLLATEHEARACSVALACGFPLPANTTRVPSNAPALGVGMHGTNVPSLSLTDESGAPVPTTRESTGGSTFLRLAGPLKEGATYNFTVGCNLDGGASATDAGVSIEPSTRKVTGGAPTPLPTSLGKLKLLDSRDEALSTPGQADCQGLRRAKIARLRWTPDPSLAPFGPVLLVRKNGAADFYAGNNGSGNDSLKVELGSGTSPLEFDVKLSCVGESQRAVLTGGVFGAPPLPTLEVDVPACETSPGDAPVPGASEGGCSVGALDPRRGAVAGLGALGVLALAVGVRRARSRRS